MSLQIRDIYHVDLYDYWISIFNVLCKLCPRPKPSIVDSPTEIGGISINSKGTANASSKVKPLDQSLAVSGIPVTFISDFGQPKYGLSFPSWRLLILSRLATEDILVNLLNIKVNLYATIDRPEVKEARSSNAAGIPLPNKRDTTPKR